MNSSIGSKRLNYCATDLEAHMRFICPECGVEHQSQQDWRKHLNDHHCYNMKGVKDFDFKEINDKYHECQICFRWVANAHQSIALLQYHRFLHLPYSRTYQCRHCEGAFTRKRALCEHLLRYHQLKVKPKKSNVEAEKKSARNPMENAEFYIRFICPQCGHLFERYQQWIYHINNAHYVTSTDLRMHRISNSRSHYCIQCKRLFCTDDKTILQSHRFTHLPYKNYFQCAFCTVKKTLKTDVLRHFIYVHTKEYETTKMHLKVPEEWGATITESCKLELQDLVENGNLKNKNSCNSKNETDLIQKALRNSFINLEEEDEDMDDKTESSKNYISYSSSSTSTSNNKNDDTLNTNELDEICTTFFEEIEEQNEISHIPLKTEIKLESDDDEKVVSIEIDAVSNNTNNSDICVSPKRKRVKLNDEQTNTETYNKPKCEYEKYIKYLCPQCGEEFENQKLWRQHVFTDHDLAKAIDNNFRELDDKNSYLCLECMEVMHTTASPELQRHYFQHMPHQSYLRCTFCNRTKSSKPKIIHHLDSCHAQQIGPTVNEPQMQPRQFKCTNCEKEFRTQARYQNHRSQCVLRQTNNVKTNKIADYLKLLEHLRKARKRIRQYL